MFVDCDGVQVAMRTESVLVGCFAGALDSPTHRANVSLMPTRTIAYLRVSTDKQADRGVSLDAQGAKAEAYGQLYDLELVEVIVDAGESAKSLNRPGLHAPWRC